MAARTAAVSQFVVPAFGGRVAGGAGLTHCGSREKAKASLRHSPRTWAEPSVLPNPSLQPTRYGWLCQPTRAAELKRWAYEKVVSVKSANTFIAYRSESSHMRSPRLPSSRMFNSRRTFTYGATRTAAHSMPASALIAPTGTNVGQSHNAAASTLARPGGIGGNTRRRGTASSTQLLLPLRRKSAHTPNPSLQPTCYGWLRQPPQAAELKR